MEHIVQLIMKQEGMQAVTLTCNCTYATGLVDDLANICDMLSVIPSKVAKHQAQKLLIFESFIGVSILQ